MRQIFYNIAKNINVLNVLLLMVLIVLSIYVLTSLLRKDLKEILPSPVNVETGLSSASTAAKIPPQIDFNMIAAQNLFHPERKAPVLDKDGGTEVPKPDLILFGTLITDKTSIAFIEDKRTPYYTPGRGKRQTQLRKGDKINEYVLKEVEPDRIVLVKGEDRLVFMLDDGEKRRGDQSPLPPSAPITGLPSTRSLVPSPSGARTNQPVTGVQVTTDTTNKARVGSAGTSPEPGNVDSTSGTTPQSRREQLMQKQRERLRMLQELNKKTP